MSKVKIQGNASGTGVVTLTAPNTNTDRTITLPDEDITLGGGVDGIVSTANATAITIDSSERVNIGDLGLTPDTTADNLSIEGVGAGMSILTHDGGQGKIVFGEQADTSKAMIGFYSGGTDRLVFSGADSSTEHLAITNDGRGLSQFTAKAWVHLDQPGTQAIQDSHNVSSIADEGTGWTKVSFTNNMGNDNYAVATSSNHNSHQGIYTLTTSYFHIAIMNSGGSYEDRNYVSAIVFGD